MKTKVINLLGAPGTGKSTIACELFAKMKWKGMDVEIVSEYAKELVWEQRHKTFENQLYIFGKQYHKMNRLKGQVEYIITDCPLFLSDFYNTVYGDDSSIFSKLVRNKIDEYDNFNFFLKRTKPYVEKGRNQTEEEADHFADLMRVHLEVKDISYIELNALQNVTTNAIIERIKY